MNSPSKPLLLMREGSRQTSAYTRRYLNTNNLLYESNPELDLLYRFHVIVCFNVIDMYIV